MNFWEYMDRREERRAHRDPVLRLDTKTLIGFGFLLGYYLIVILLMRDDVPQKNIDLVRDAMLTLGPAVGLIVGAIFRTDMRDQQASVNTAKAFDAVKAAAQAGTSSSSQDSQPDVVLQPGETAQADPNPGDR